MKPITDDCEFLDHIFDALSYQYDNLEKNDDEDEDDIDLNSLSPEELLNSI